MTTAGGSTGTVVQVPTLGWDLVYAVRIGPINAQIAAANVSPPKFSGSIGSLSVNGQFGPWQIATGGAGAMVMLELPIASGTFADGATPPVSFSGAVTVSVMLEFRDQESGRALQIQQVTSAPGETKGAAETTPSQLFTIQNLTLTPASGAASVDIVTQAAVQAVLQEWLTNNSQCFQHVLAVVNMGDVDPARPYSWLQPTSTAYAYVDDLTQQDGVLAILGMTNQRSPAGLDQQVSPEAVAAGRDAAVLISPYLLLDWVIRPALPSAFPGTAATDYTLSTEQPILSLGAPCQLTPFTSGGDTYTPTLQSLSVNFEGNQLQCSTETSTPVGFGVIAWTSTQATQGVQLTTTPAGQPTLAFYDLAQPVTNTWTATDPSTQRTDDDIADALALAGMVLSMMTGGMAGFIIMVTATLLSGLIQNLPTLAAAFISQTSPSVDLLAVNATSPITWSGGTRFALTNVDLVESLRLSGTPWPAAAGTSSPA